MIKTITIKSNQSLPDMVLMACGTMEGAMRIMATNDTGISTAAVVNAVYTIPADVVTDSAALAYLAQNRVQIGTLAAG